MAIIMKAYCIHAYCLSHAGRIFCADVFIHVTALLLVATL